MNAIEEYVYGLTLDGCLDDETGDASEAPAWFGLQSIGDSERAEINRLEPDCEESRASACIIKVDSDGFKTFAWYTTQESADVAWHEIEQAVDSWYADESEE